MKRKISKKTVIISVVAVILSSVILMLLNSYIGLNPFKSFELSDVSDFDVCEDGSLFVLNNTGFEFLRIDENRITSVVQGRRPFSDLFYRGVQVCHDGDGNVYVLSKISDAVAGSAYREERVVEFTSVGFHKNDCMTIVHEKPVFCPSIVELQNINGRVYAIVAQENDIYIRDVLTLKDIFGPVSLQNADRLIKDAKYDQGRGCLYLVLKTGAVLCYDDDWKTVFEPEEDDERTVLSDIGITSDGKILVSDIGAKSLSEITPEGRRIELASLEDMPYKIICSTQDESVLLESTYNISEYRDGKVSTDDELKYSFGCIALIITAFLFVIILILSAIYLLVSVLVLLIGKMSEKVRSLALTSLFAVLLTALFCLLMKQSMSETLKNDAIEKMQDEAALINQVIDGDSFKKIRTCGDFVSDEYNAVKDACEKVILSRGTEANNYYTIIYTLEGDDEVYVRYSTEEEYGCNYPYIWSDGTDERAIYDTGESAVFPDPSYDPTGSYVDVYDPLYDSAGNVVGVIEVGCDYNVLVDEVNSVVLQMSVSIFALMIVVLLIVIEGIEYFHERKTVLEASGNGKRTPTLKMYRLVVFLVFFVTNLTTPFLSLYSLELSEEYEGFLGMSTEVLSAIPISAEVLFGAVFSILGNRIILKLNRRKSAFIGFVLFFVGLVIRFVYPDFFVLTLGNGMQGAGWGILLLIVNSTIAAEEDPEKQEEGFTGYNMALQNGMNSGVVAGGFLLVFIGHRSVLIIAAAISVIMFPFIKSFVFDKDMTNLKQKSGEKVSFADTVRFIFKPRILLYFIGIVIPVIGASYYLFYLYPIIGNSFGISETMVGYSYLIMGIITICFSNIIVKFISRLFSKKVALVIASFIYLITFAIVGVFYNTAALIIALVLLPVSDSFGYVIQETYYSELEETKALGYEKAMGVYSLFENLAQAAGTIVFGYILTVGVSRGLIVFGIVIAAASLVFCVFSKGGKKEKKVVKKD